MKQMARISEREKNVDSQNPIKEINTSGKFKEH